MEPLSYDDNPLIQEIRQNHDRTRQSLERAANTPEPLQVELGPSTPGSDPASGKDRKDEHDAGGGSPETGEHLPASNKNARRVRRTNAKDDKDSLGADTGNRPADHKVRSDKRKRVTNEEKPSGIQAKPNAREKAEQKPASEKAGIFNAWGRGSNKDKAQKPAKPKKEPLRSRPFTEQEAEAIKGPLLAALLDYFRYADDLIYATNKKHEQVQIWSTIDPEDAEFLVDVWLRRARTSAKAASHVTAVVHKHEELRVAAIALPRAYQTFMVYFQNGIGVR
jgi:hypothetical protein